MGPVRFLFQIFHQAEQGQGQGNLIVIGFTLYTFSVISDFLSRKIGKKKQNVSQLFVEVNGTLRHILQKTDVANQILLCGRRQLYARCNMKKFGLHYRLALPKVPYELDPSKRKTR